MGDVGIIQMKWGCNKRIT